MYTQEKTLPLGLLLASFLLISCAQAPKSQKEESPSPIIPEATAKFWQQDGCFLKAEHNGVYLKTDGTLSHNTLRFSVNLPPIITAPHSIRFHLEGIPNISLNPTGRDQSWSFELLNTPYTTAYMLSGKAFIQVHYRPERTLTLPAPEAENSIFPLYELPHLLLQLYQTCGQKE